MERFKRLFLYIALWRMKGFKQKRFLILISIIIGICGGLMAILLKNAVHYIGDFFIKLIEKEYLNILFLAFPLVGILLTVLFIRFFVKEDIGHGISYVLKSISRYGGKMKSKHMYSGVVGSSITVGLGGSVGLEAPIVFTGSAIGSFFARLLRMNYKTTILLIGCGSAAAIAAIFKSPIAAVVFSLEVLMLDLTISSIIPLLISSVTGVMLANFFLGNEVVFYFSLKDPVPFENLPFYIVLGLITGLVSVYFIRTTGYIEGLFAKLKNKYTKVIIGGIVLGLLIFLLPPLYGEGYAFLKEILSGNAAELTNNSLFFSFKDNYWMFLLFLFLVMIIKVVAMAVTVGAGGVGGVFAPSLYIGGLAGYIGAKALNYTGFIRLSESNFSLVGMAGMIAGVMGAPLTAIFLIAELSGGYTLFVPLIITAAISYLTTQYFEKHSIYTKRLAEKGDLMTHDKDKSVLMLMKLKSLIEDDFSSVKPNDSLRDLTKAISHSNRNIFPVINDKGEFVGVVYLDHIRHLIFNADLYDQMNVSNLMVESQQIIDLKDSMGVVMSKFEESESWNLPVTDNGKYIGFLSKSKLFNEYREIMQELTSD